MRGGIAQPSDRTGDSGFTLIELLVVVLLIGVLAAIAVPIYRNVQASATDSAVESDLQNLKKAVVIHTTRADGAFAAVSALGTADGYPGPSITYAASASPSYATASGPTSTVPASGAGFCVAAQSPAGSWFYATDARGVTKVTGGTGLCS